jgi:hypothetical protein
MERQLCGLAVMMCYIINGRLFVHGVKRYDRRRERGTWRYTGSPLCVIFFSVVASWALSIRNKFLAVSRELRLARENAALKINPVQAVGGTRASQLGAGCVVACSPNFKTRRCFDRQGR